MLNKHLGQHFLVNKQIVADILRAGEVSKKDTVLEVGPGKGVLTEALAKKTKKVIAIEKDKALVEYLKEKFKNQKNIEIIYGDILKIENWKLKIGNYKIVANIPYYITSRFLRMFLSQARLRSSLMILMLQKEVAERIVAKNSKESLLSLSVKAYGEPKIIKIVKRGNFFPPPKVNSAIIKIICDPKLRIYPNAMKSKFGSFGFNLDHSDRVKEQVLSLARKAFQQKRKMLRHSLGKNIPEKYRNKRPEELRLEDWDTIYLSQSSPQPTP